MEVMIGDKIYSSDNQPILIRLSQIEKNLIGRMQDKDTKFCAYPEGMSLEDVKKFMSDG